MSTMWMDIHILAYSYNGTFATHSKKKLIHRTSWINFKITTELMEARTVTKRSTCWMIPWILNCRKEVQMKLSWQKGEELLPNSVVRRRRRGYQGTPGNFQGWWICSLSWLWHWLHGCPHAWAYLYINFKHVQTFVHQFYLIKPKLLFFFFKKT